jgi:hypothetical protein
MWNEWFGEIYSSNGTEALTIREEVYRLAASMFQPSPMPTDFMPLIYEIDTSERAGWSRDYYDNFGNLRYWIDFFDADS